jgi:DNA-binding NarL/FixJ family response regulator
MSVPVSDPATAFVIESDSFARWALSQYLELLQYKVLTAETYTDASALIAGHPTPRLVVVDLALRDNPAERIPQQRSRGITLVHALKRRDPAVAVVIRSDYGGTVAPILPLLTSGYTGLAYVAKSSPREVLDDAISYALRQDIFFQSDIDHAATDSWDQMFLDALEPEVAATVIKLVRCFDELTPQQRAVAERMVYTTEAIAHQFGIRVTTVRKYIDTIYDYLELKNRETVARYRRDVLLALAYLLRRLRATA